MDIPLIKTAFEIQTTNYASTAATVIYIYDILISFDKEVEFFWRKFTFNIVNTLYIINRYICLVLFFNAFYKEESCVKLKLGIGYQVGRAACEGIMTLLSYALWKGNKAISRAIWSLWGVNQIVMCSVGGYAYKEFHRAAIYDPRFNVCLLTAKPNAVVTLTMISPTIYALFPAAIAIIKSLESSPFRMKSLLYPLTIVLVLTAHGLEYYILSFVLSTINLMSWYLSQAYLISLLISISWALMSIFVSRLVLHIREFYHKENGATGPTNGLIVSDAITFASPGATDLMMGRDISLPTIQRHDADDSATPIVDLDEHQQWDPVDVESGSGHTKHASSSVQHPMQIAVPLRTFPRQGGS
ncbi:hypothetical protein CPB86DRAFT_209962 [Serendipita vermifera]|nr:hypothetical protein CPB86DRAFT_209962 [Serendipita vermifera]